MLAARLAQVGLRHPFFEDRYGDRGRRHARQDNDHHLDYLIAAIRLNSPETLAHYFGWLRGVLVNRGMCTYHLRNNMERRADHLRSLLPDLWPVLEPYLNGGYAGLDYKHPGSRRLAALEADLARRIADRVETGSTIWVTQYGERADTLCREDQRFLLSYLNDAVGLNMTESLAGYLAWLKDYRRRHGIAPEHLRANLSALADAVERELGADATPFTRLLSQQQAYL